MKLKKALALLIAGSMLACSSAFAVACGDKEEVNHNGPNTTSSDTLYVKTVKNIPDNFIMGMDLSSAISLEKSGVKFYDFDGKEADLFKTVSENGINTVRVRVWNDPYDKNGNSYGGGNNDIDTAVEIGKRVTKYGMSLMVDFHYSDFWADPNKQMVPKAWKGMKIAEKSEALYNYTKESLQKLVDAGVKVGMVQVGNETNGKLCGEDAWFKMADLFEAGSKAVREVCPDALVAVHFANPEKVTNFQDYASKLDYYAIDYDVFASSYYPYWHGTLDNLSSLLGEIGTKYNKKVMVAETSYAFTDADTDGQGNTIGAGSAVVKDYPYTVQGQANCIRNIIDTMAHTPNGIGVCYWEGAWITVNKDGTWETNSMIWEQYGSGWASSYASEYDPNDAGKYYGGSAVDNQAFFDASGKPIESLKLFGLVYQGNEVENKPDALEDVNIICDLNGTIELPDKINAVMRDDSKKEVDVKWNITEADKDKMYKGGVAKYEVKGDAGGMEAHCYISMVEYNFLKNYSFEDDANTTPVPTGWKVTSKTENKKGSFELCVEDKATDSITGTKHFHFWGGEPNSVEFTLEQDVALSKAGKYKYSISIMGSDAGDTEIYAFVKINGSIVKKAELSLVGYNNWQTGTITDIEYNGTDKITVGIFVKCSGSGNGAWGKIDDALFNSVS